MNRRRAARLLPLMALAFLSGCGEGGGLADFIVDINNIWSVQGASNYSYSFNAPQQAEVSTSTFTGEEDRDGTVSTLRGSYTGRQIQFTVSRSTGAVDFSGEFRNKNTIAVQGGGQSLTITRG